MSRLRPQGQRDGMILNSGQGWQLCSWSQAAPGSSQVNAPSEPRRGLNSLLCPVSIPEEQDYQGHCQLFVYKESRALLILLLPSISPFL